LQDFGGIGHFKEECRDGRRVTLAHDLVQDLRFGARMIRKNPGFTAVAVLIWDSHRPKTAIFSFIDAVHAADLAGARPGELVVLNWRAAREPKTDMTHVARRLQRHP